MAQPFVGEIRMFAGNFPPVGWMFCDGNQMPISENEVLFQLIGTTYGGDGEETFNLPNLQSRIPLHQGTGPDGITYQLGEAAGEGHEVVGGDGSGDCDTHGWDTLLRGGGLTGHAIGSVPDAGAIRHFEPGRTTQS